MTRTVLRLLPVVLLILGLSAMARGEGLRTTIKFPFKAAGSMLPAGPYSIDVSRAEEHLLILRNVDTRISYAIPYETRLSARADASVVFDKDGDDFYLAEVYVPGIDGFLLNAAPAKHTHVMVPSGQ